MTAFNYFNYFTEIEEYFWRKRGAHLLVSPLDWAIVETWQKAGIPLDAVLRGIDRAFESYPRSRRAAGGRTEEPGLLRGRRPRRRRGRKGSRGGHGPAVTRVETKPTETFSRERVARILHAQRRTDSRLRQRAARDAARTCRRLEETRARIAELLPLIDSPGALDLEDLERRLTVIEEKLTAALTAARPKSSWSTSAASWTASSRPTGER